MHRFALALALALGLTVAAASCTHPSSAVGNANGALITRDEIENSHAVTALDVISRLRPYYLGSRGRTSINLDPQTHAMVFLNDQEYGDITVLRNLSANDIEEVHYFSGSQAVQKFGAQYGGGVIQLISRVQ